MRVRLLLSLASLFGVLVGLGIFTFNFAEGWSYFSADPRACVNCHIMREPYDSWQKSSHRESAKCVDCHLPHAAVPKLVAKARNGFQHARGFTFQDFHEPLRITADNARALQGNCVACHRSVVAELGATGHGDAGDISCVRCHAGVGHGPVR